LFVVVPWQGARDRAGDAAAVPPVPAGPGYTREAVTILDSGAWWRVEPDYSLFLVRNVQFATHNASHWRIASAYGPWGFLFRGYHPANYWISVVIWSLLAGLASYLAYRIGGWPAAIALAVILAANPRPLLLMVLPLLVAHAAPLKRSLAVPSIAALALISLVKSSSLALSVIVTAATSVAFPLAAVVYVVAFLLLFLIAGQDIGWLIPFLRATWHVSSTYGEAEVSSGVSTGLVLPIVGAALVLLEIRRRRWPRALVLAAVVLAFMKTALVRSDMFHAELAPCAAAALLIIYAAEMGRFRYAALAAAFVLAVAYLPPPAELGRQAIAMANPIGAKRDSDRIYANDLAWLRARTPLPPVRGSVDVYGERQSLAIAHALAYRPRPIYQSYIAYDAYLARINAERLRAVDAPDVILFSMARSDERFPSLDDGLSWPDLMTRYRVAATSPEFALMQKATPSAYTLKPCGTIEAVVGQTVPMPANCRGLVWSQIVATPTFAGRLLATLYKIPTLTLTTHTQNGETIGGRLIRRTAAAGFLLSPVIVGPVDFAAAASGRADTLAPREVQSLVADTSARGLYQRAVSIRLYELRF
jgi:hypothetical protein